MEKSKKIFIIIVAIISAIAILDILSMNSGIFGTPTDYTFGHFIVNGQPVLYWNLFFQIGLVMIALVSLVYWIIKKDFSESISIFIGSIILWFTGLPDLFFFFFQGKLPPATLSWLNGGYIYKIGSLLGFHEVTRISLIIVITISIIITYFIVKLLTEKI